jgi:chemotaxis protein MotB
VPARVEPREPPVKTRGFPLRLWLYALLMTGAAGGIGYFAWNQRSDLDKKKGALTACEKDLTPARNEAKATGDKLRTCEDDLGKTAARQKDEADQLAKMQTNLSATKDELTALRAQRVETEKRMAAIADIQAQFAKMIDTGELKVAARRGGLVVELPSEVLFPSGSAELSDPGKMKVHEVGFVLKRFPDRRFLVVGHTDNVPLKSTTMADNWALSTARALTVTRELVKAGMKPTALVPAGAGEHDPLVPNSSSGDRQRNRRIEIQLLPQITELPPLPATLGESDAKP